MTSDQYMVVTIDGPAGAGKSSVSRELARRLGFRFLDTGAMYRAVALAALERGSDLTESAEVEALANAISIEVTDDQILLDGRDVSQAIRTPQVTAAIHHVADNGVVRGILVDLQRRLGGMRDTVTEGRDQGTVAFPHAQCKIFLTASPEERARRRVQDLAARGVAASYEEILAAQNERDRRDSSRAVGRMVQTDEMTELITDGLTPLQVVERLEEIVRSRMAQLPAPSQATNDVTHSQ